MITLEILSCGPSTTIQDAGRLGFSRIGLPSAGAMDHRALRIANALVGNSPGEAAVELAFAGLVMRANGGAVQLAMAGARAEIECESRSIQMYRSFLLNDGETLRIGPMTDGVYAILAIAGGIAVPPVLGSRSLDARAGIGGLNGRPLRNGDRIPVHVHAATSVSTRWSDAVSLDLHTPIRIVLGPQDHLFTERGLQTLIGRTFSVSHSINRMAYRLDGPVIERQPDVELISDGTLPGSIQVPPDGYPIVLMADRQTVGGYPKIATVIGADLAKLAQRRPGEDVVFALVSAQEAREIARQLAMSELNIRVADNPEGLRLFDPELFNLDCMTNIADAVVDARDYTTWDATTASNKRSQ